MGAAGGTFFGYREEEVASPRPPRLRPQGSVSAMKLSPLIIAGMAVSGYDYFAHAGDAPDDYPSVWTVLPGACRMATWTIKGGFLEVQLSYDGVVVGDQREIRYSTSTLDSFVAYRVRKFEPGTDTWYQLVAII